MRNKKTDQILELCDQYMDRNSALPVNMSQVKKWLNKEFDNKVDRYNKEHGTRKTTAEEITDLLVTKQLTYAQWKTELAYQKLRQLIDNEKNSITERDEQVK
jgi:hypothetical protein